MWQLSCVTCSTYWSRSDRYWAASYQSCMAIRCAAAAALSSAGPALETARGHRHLSCTRKPHDRRASGHAGQSRRVRSSDG
jgi:hypothetical protein